MKSRLDEIREAQGYGHFELGVFGIEDVVISEHLWSPKGAYGVTATADCCHHRPHGLHTVRLFGIFERAEQGKLE